MNIAIFINNIFASGGTEIVSKEYANRYCKDNIVHIISMNSSNNQIQDCDISIKIFSVRKDASSSVLSSDDIDNILNYCKKNKIERSVFIINIPHRGSPVSNLKLIRDVSKISKTEVVFHNSPRSYLKRYRNIEKCFIGNFLRQIKTQVLIAPHAKRFVKLLPEYGVEIYVLNHGCQVELKRYYGIDSKIRYNVYNFIYKSDFVKRNIVTYVGRIVFEKNIHLLISAWKKAKTAGWVLRLIGDGNKTEYFKDLCTRLHITNIEFTGSIDHSKIYDYLAESKICCLTSFYEGFPTVIVEGMNMKNAIVTTKYDGFSNELLNEHTAIISGYSTDEYANALNTLLTNETLLTNMQESAYETAKYFYNSKDYLNNI